MEAGGPSSGRRRRRRRVGEVHGGGTDRISDLPDDVLGEIISLLPTKEGARTQILASRWRHLWRSAPLNLDFRGLVNREDELAGVVSRILSSHQGPGRRFCTPRRPISYGADTLDAWLRSPAVANLEELYLCYPTAYHLPVQLLSESISRFSTTLCGATITSCQLPDVLQGLQFPNLKQLTLEEVRISECSLQHMIAGCPVLECLMIHESFGFSCVRINSVSLRSISVRAQYYWRDGPEFKQLEIDNAPSLESLLQLVFRSHLHVSVNFTPKLESLYCHSYSPAKIMFGSTVIQGAKIYSLTTAVHSIKILAVDMGILSLDTVIDLMKCFPSLEKLYIQTSNSGPNNLWLRKHKKLIRCHDIRLKKIVFEWYWGIRSQINFVTFFVLNASALESMTLRIQDRDYNEKFLAEHRRKLQLENRASRGARFQFITNMCVRNIREIKDIHDFNLPDPFAC
uniref:Uncharacterized protein n=1 Tax=Avena sativa TaxID=4498 RepID=A0ACD5YJJ9_AVESA